MHKKYDKFCNILTMFTYNQFQIQQNMRKIMVYYQKLLNEGGQNE
jgi:hypothetical protein